MDVVTKNEFEYDWCTCACDEAKAAARKLANSRWLICAQQEDNFLGLLVRFLHFTDQRFNLGMSITLLTAQEKMRETAERFPYAQVKQLTETAEPIEAEYCVFCGYTGDRMTIADDGEYKRALNRVDIFWKGIARATRRSICISNAQIYDPYPSPLVAAEGEFQSESTDLTCRFYREAEQTVRQTQHEYVILRPSAILAAGETFKSRISAFLDELIFHSGKQHITGNARYSVLYITDFLTVFLLAANELRPQEVYNVSSDDTTVSMLELCDLSNSMI